MDSIIFGHIATIFSIVFAVAFGYMYFTDRDKRKLMFLIAFISGVFANSPRIITGWENFLILRKLTLWVPLITLSALAIAVLSSLFKEKKFEKPFKAFLVVLAVITFMTVIPVPVSPVPAITYPLLSLTIIFVSISLILSRRELPDLMFLLATVCLVTAETGRTVLNSGTEFVALGYFFAYTFIFLVFITSRLYGKGGISSFFSLQKEFEKTQKELEISQDQLTRAETNFKSLVDLIPDPLSILDHEGHFLEVNDRAAELTGFSREELIGKNFLEIGMISREVIPIVTKKLAERMMGKEAKPYELEIKSKKGKTLYLELNAKKIEYKGKPADLVIYRDVSERKMMEEKLVKSERLAAIGQAATMVGHDLRNPLQAIENGLYFLDTELSNFPVSKKTTDTLEAVHRSIDYADNIVRDLQSFASNRTPAFRDININKLVKDTIQYAKKPKNIETVMEFGQIPEIEADEDMVKRILVNLAINGIQAMKEKGGTLKVSTKKMKDSVEITFEDTGTGIKKENLEKIFIPFFTTKAQGMGIGLAICKRLVELHGGSITVDSKEGEGATFTVDLPIQRNGGGKT